MDLSTVDIKQLHAEIERRKRIQAEEEQRARLENARFTLSITDNLLKLLFPQHTRSSCSDSDPQNARRGCTRCMLLNNRDGDGEYMIENVTFTSVPYQD